MLLYFSLMLISIAWVSILKVVFPKHITMKEMITQVILSVVVSLMFMAGDTIYKNSLISDTTVITGKVTDKKKVKVSCSHSYDCYCYDSCSGTGENRTCTRICQTCYEHSHDFDWRVYSDIGELEISRVDRQGVKTPKRWTEVIIGEPFSKEVDFDNYFNISPDSLFTIQYDKNYTSPSQPRVFDYYRLNPVVTDLAQFKDFGDMLNNTIKTGTKKVNVNMIITKNPVQYAYAVENDWIGGRDNGVNIVIGSDKNSNINWVYVFTYAKNNKNHNFVVNLRDNILQLESLDDRIFPVIKNSINKLYSFSDTEEFQYLEEGFSSDTAQLVASIIVLLINIIASYIFYRIDFGSSGYGRRFNRNWRRY